MANIVRVGGGGVRAVPNVFGDGSDGALIAAGNTVWNADAEDTGMVIKNFTSLTIPAGVTVSAGNRNCGMILRVQGDCTIAGTLANRKSPKTLRESDNVDFSMWPLSMLSGAAGDGGAGGGAHYGGAVSGGAGMLGRFYGGGWSGGGAGSFVGVSETSACIPGGVDTVTTATPDSELFKGSTCLGMSQPVSTTIAYNGGGGGGVYNSGGYLWYIPGATGAGSDGSDGSSSASGGAGNYGGGVIILLVAGTLTITGTVDCGGCAGGDAGKLTSDVSFSAGPGGGGGGGRIFICHKGALVNTGTLNVSGGSAGAAFAASGVNGTAGTTSIKTWAEYKAEDVGQRGEGTPVVSVASLPENPEPHTIYLVRAEDGDTT